MRIVFAGTPDVAVTVLEGLLHEGHNIVGVMTREDAPLGRKRVMTPSPVAVRAEAAGIPVYATNRPDAAAEEWLRALQPDVGVVVAYGALLRRSTLDVPRLGWVNLHYSDLPRWRGAAPVQRALIAGEQTLGTTVFRLVEELDAGDVLVQERVALPPETTAGEALETLSRLGTAHVTQALDMLARDPGAGQPQRGESTYAHKLTRADGKLDPHGSTAQLLARWAGVTPEPGAFVTHEGQPLKVWELTRMADEADTPGAPGTVTLRSGRAVLRTGDGAVELRTVQPAGRGRMSGDAWLRGRGGEAMVE